MLRKTNSQNYTNIANTIRNLNGRNELYKPVEMTAAFGLLFPEQCTSYDAFDENGNPTSATVYGDKILCLSGQWKLQNVSFRSVITDIPDNAFDGCLELYLELPETVRSIGESAFAYCYSLDWTALPAGLEHLGYRAFFVCTELALTSLPEGVKIIDGYTFLGCESLRTMRFHSGIRSIGHGAFEDCTGLTEVTFYGKPDDIYSNAFSGCINLTAINVPWSEGEVAGAPWGATNATINYNYTE